MQNPIPSSCLCSLKQRPIPFLDWRNLAVTTLFTLFPLCLASASRPIIVPPPVIQGYPITKFQTQLGQTTVSWTETTLVTDGTSTGMTGTFQDGNGGTATIHWSRAYYVDLWTINSVAGGTQTYTSAQSEGYPGAFILTSGTAGADDVITINTVLYQLSNSLLASVQGSSVSGSGLFAFVFGSTSYSAIGGATDCQGVNWINVAVSDGSNPTVYACSASFLQANQTNYIGSALFPGIQINFSDGTYAHYYADVPRRSFTYVTTSTAPNGLKQFNGYPLTVANNMVSLPASIQSFGCSGSTFALTACAWNYAYYSTDPLQNHSLTLTYTGANGTATGDFFPGGQISEFDVITGSSTFGLANGGILRTYQVLQGDGSLFTAFNGQPYAWTGSLLVPQGPVSAFTYGGSAYQFSNYAQAGDGNLIAQYQTAGSNPQTASLEYSPVTDALVKLSVDSPSGGTATYVDGASVGRPGAYVWSEASTAANLLTTVNNNSYNPNGDAALPTTAQSTSGVFDIQGNFMNLGSWSTDTSHVGMSLAYYDGTTSSVPANIEFTASRPSTSWSWDAASADGTLVNSVMQIDETSRLLLFPPADPQATAPSLPTPSVVLDPNPAGVSRFDGAVRISQQGDLSMGEFTSEPTPTPGY